MEEPMAGNDHRLAPVFSRGTACSWAGCALVWSVAFAALSLAKDGGVFKDELIVARLHPAFALVVLPALSEVLAAAAGVESAYC